jgi:EpsD family peptidyl-prolyl cis-trans isomerase
MADSRNVDPEHHPSAPTEDKLNSKVLFVVLAVGTSLTLSGCDKIKGLIGGKPSGQVIATVNGQEITALELRAEMGNFASRDPKIMKQAQQQALQQIIMRDLLVQKAKEQKLDKSTDYTLQVRRGEENLLAQLYERKLASTVTAPTRQEAVAYVDAHPDQFAGRRILTLDQVIAPPSKIDPQRFAPLKTLEEVKALFESQGVPFQENSAELDTLSANPNVVQQITKLPPGEVFVIPQRGVFVFNRISGTRSVPFKGDLATNYALNALRQQRAQTSVGTQLQAMRKAADAKIVYSAGYKPPTPPTPPKPGAAAPAAAGAAAPAPASATPPAKK